MLEVMQQNIDLRFLSAPTDLYPLLNKKLGQLKPSLTHPALKDLFCFREIPC